MDTGQLSAELTDLLVKLDIAIASEQKCVDAAGVRAFSELCVWIDRTKREDDQLRKGLDAVIKILADFIGAHSQISDVPDDILEAHSKLQTLRGAKT